MKTAFIFLAIATTVVGCASTGVIPTGPDTYLISKQSAAGIFGTPYGVEADIYKQANAFCAQSGQVVQTVNVVTKAAVPFVREGSASLNFKCVPKGNKQGS
ncbi:MAG: hypothetical protein WBR15_05640 [Gammaproteobacteria bacterium]